MKKKIIFIILVAFLLITLICLVYLIFFRIRIDNSKIKYKDNLDVLVYSKVSISDLIENIDGRVINDFYVGTDSLGEREIKFLYEDKKGRKNYGTVSINIVDTEEPIIYVNNTYTINVNSDKKLEDIIMSVDNYDNNPKREIIGNYDINKEGSYNLEYKVTDNSGNIASKKFTLKVVDPDKNKKPNTSKKDSYISFNDAINNYKTKDTMIGIDVSKWQGEIDYSKVKDAKAEFVMIKVGGQDTKGGDNILDPTFENNIEGFSSLGFKIGIYYYSHASNIKEAKEQAKWVISKVSKYNIDLPIVFDWENWSNFNTYNVSLHKLNVISDTFISEIENYGYKGMLYGSKYYLENIWNVDNKNIWLANYATKTEYDKEYMMWQMCSDGKIDGIDSYVDVDILYKNK